MLFGLEKQEEGGVRSSTVQFLSSMLDSILPQNQILTHADSGHEDKEKPGTNRKKKTDTSMIPLNE